MYPLKNLCWTTSSWTTSLWTCFRVVSISFQCLFQYSVFCF